MELSTFWFLLIGVLWTGYFFLEGFDFGVGMLLHPFAKDDTERRVLLNTIGPVWDGNEVWLLTAGGATFAAFPNWYATLFSGFYLALFLILVSLILRGVAIEYRGKVDSDAWRARWDVAIAIGSWTPAVLWGVAFANIVAGVPINENGDFTGTLLTLLNPFALLGGVVTASLFLLHGLHFVALKTEGQIHDRAKAASLRVAPGHDRRRRRVPHLEPARARRDLDLDPRGRGGRGPGAVRPGNPGRARRMGVRGHRGRDRRRGGRPLRLALPRRDAQFHGPGVQPHRRERQLHALHAEDHELGGRLDDPRGPRIPGLVVLDLPQAHRHPPHPTGPRPRRHLTGSRVGMIKG